MPEDPKAQEEHAPCDFLVSYTKVDLKEARWIADQLEEGAYTVIFQEWDFVSGSFIMQMMSACDRAKRVIAVCSDEYFQSRPAMAELSAFLAQDPDGRDGLVILVLVRELTLPAMLGPFIYADLVPFFRRNDEDGAVRCLLERVRPARRKPEGKAPFPTESAPPA